jgi:hypothetical protein
MAALLLIPGAIFILVTAAYLLPGLGASSASDVNQALPIVLSLNCAYTAFRLVRADRVMIMSPLFWFLCTSVLYFGIGPLLYYYGAEESIAYSQIFYFCNETTLLKTNMLNAFCITVVYAVCSIGMLTFGPPRRPGRPLFSLADRNRFITITLIFGCPVRYILSPMNARLDIQSYIPQQILILGDLVYVGIYLLVNGFVRGDRNWLWVLVPLLGWELVNTVLGGSKLSFFLFGLSVFLGVYMARPSAKVFVLGVAIGVVGYLVMTQITNAVRSVGLVRNVSMSKRAEAVSEFQEQYQWDSSDRFDTVQKGWIRLAYWTAQAYCIEQYDHGYRGKTLELIYWTFVPRLLYPDKPVITPGRQFNIEVTGNENSKSAPGFFAEAYWAGGWLLAVAVSAYVGLLFAALTRVASYSIRRSDYRWFPFIWFGIVSGLRPDDWFVAAFVASFPLALLTCLIISLFMTPNRHDAAYRDIGQRDPGHG